VAACNKCAWPNIPREGRWSQGTCSAWWMHPEKPAMVLRWLMESEPSVGLATTVCRDRETSVLGGERMERLGWLETKES
jgi:hypothetical protein